MFNLVSTPSFTECHSTLINLVWNDIHRQPEGPETKTSPILVHVIIDRPTINLSKKVTGHIHIFISWHINNMYFKVKWCFKSVRGSLSGSKNEWRLFVLKIVAHWPRPIRATEIDSKRCLRNCVCLTFFWWLI